VLSHNERRTFDAISQSLAADPYISSVSRAADRRARRYRVWKWMAPLVVARREARYVRRLAQGY
jgi:hypothetical protein